VQRKIVTVLFCDVTDSTALGETLDPEAVRALLAEYFERVGGIVAKHGGTVEKFIGDAVMAVFGVPVAHEDDALRALRASEEMMAALPALGIQGRVGINTGEVITGTDERLVTGDPVNVAARLQQAAEPGEVLIGDGTFTLVRRAIEVAGGEALSVKGKTSPVSAYRLLRVLEMPEDDAGSPFVGRKDELARLDEAWRRTQTERRCELVLVVGEAGIGKSRLTTEFLREVRTQVVRGRALPYGEGITYWPAVEVLTQLGIDPPPDAATGIRTILREGDATSSHEEIAWAFRKTLEHAARQQPLVVVFDDIHWADERFLDLMEHIGLLSTGAAILVIALARPELAERRPTWPITIQLRSLPDDDAELLIPTRVTAPLREKIARAAGGNPLFLREITAMSGEDSREIVVPPTLKALLTARLDLLDATQRWVIQCASVEGEIFHRGAVQALTSRETNVTPPLAELARRGLIASRAPQIATEDGFRFSHLLIRDAAYEGLPKTTRADLHQQFVAWLDAQTDVIARDEIAGYHLEQAARYRREVGAEDTKTAETAAARLGSAARSALDRGDWNATRALCRRAIDLVAEEHPTRLGLLPFYVFAIWDLDGGTLARQGIGELLRSENQPARAYGAMFAAEDAIFNGNVGSCEELEDAAKRARVVFERVGDEAGVMLAHRGIGLSRWALGRTSAMIPAFEAQLESARRLGYGRFEEEARSFLATARVFGSTPVREAIAYCERQLTEMTDRIFEVNIMRRLARAHAMDGKIDGARELLTKIRDFFSQVGLDAPAAAGRMTEAQVEWYAGEFEQAEELARAGLRALEELGDRGYARTTALYLAEYLEANGKVEEADVVLRRARELTNAAEAADAVGLDAVEARIFARRGKLARAEQLARAAWDAAGSIEIYEANLRAASALSFVFEAAGRPQEARAALKDALEIAEKKGDAVSTRRLRTQIEEASSEARASH
jgi:class 3 adenylate cyclase/tetratricopeptide (TPR) repeat protein